MRETLSRDGDPPTTPLVHPETKNMAHSPDTPPLVSIRGSLDINAKQKKDWATLLLHVSPGATETAPGFAATIGVTWENVDITEATEETAARIGATGEIAAIPLI